MDTTMTSPNQASQNQTTKYKSFAKIKANARGALLTRLTPTIFTTLFYSFLSVILSFLLNSFAYDSSIFNFIIFFVIAILLNTVNEALKYGILQYYINVCTGKKANTSTLFTAFKQTPNRTFPAIFLFAFVSSICQLPMCICDFYQAVYEPDNEMLTYLSAALLFAGLLMYYIFSLFYSMTYYVMMDFPEMKSKDALKMSAWLMKGRKMKLCLMHLSFIPLQILGLLSCNIGNLFVMPYRMASVTFFYLDLTSAKASN